MLNDPIENEPAIRSERRKPNADGPRGRYSLDFKLEVLKETFAPGASVAAIARRHGMNTNVIFRWRKEYREGRLGAGAPAGKALPPPALVPVRIKEDGPALPALPPQTAKPAPCKKNLAP